MVIYSLTLVCALLHTVASGSFRVNGEQTNSTTKSSIFLTSPTFYICNDARRFGSQLWFRIRAKKRLTVVPPQFISINPGWRINSRVTQKRTQTANWRKATTQSAVTISPFSYSIVICYCNSIVESIQFNLYNLLALQGQMSCWWSIISMEKVAFCCTPWNPSSTSLCCLPLRKQSFNP